MSDIQKATEKVAAKYRLEWLNSGFNGSSIEYVRFLYQNEIDAEANKTTLQ